MTVAVCYKCGQFKHGAFSPCQHCGKFPESEDDMALSLALTDHYFDEATLHEIGLSIEKGNPMHLSPETRDSIVKMMRESGICKMMGAINSISKHAEDGVDKKLKPWWKLF